jgi:hypothetical protein
MILLAVPLATSMQEFFSQDWKWDETWSTVIAAVIHALLLLLVFALIPMIFL